ncbi:MAG: cation:proton antiporter [Candidatus Nanoarchaeia archaeon]
MIEEQLMTLVLLFVFAIVGGIIAQKFKQPIVLGFLLIGTIIGPFALNLVKDHGFIDLVIEFGAILLMFVVGLEFTPEQMKKVGVKGLVLGILKIGIAFFLGFMASILFGLNVTDALFIGVIFSFTSTVVFVKILEQKGLIKKSEVPLMLTMLIVEDIAAVIALTMLVGAKAAAATSPLIIVENIIIGITVLILVYLFFLKFANKGINLLLQNKNEELTTFLSLALCAGLSYFAYFLGLSPTAGAFLAGSIVASVKDSKELGHAVMPHNLMFSSLFFLAVGTLINFQALIENIWVILFLLGVFVIIIFVSMGLSTYLFANMRKEQPIFCALAMLPLGEFSLLIAKEAKLFNTSLDFVSITAALIFLSTIIMSLTINKSKQIYSFLEKERPSAFKRKLNALGGYISAVMEQLDTENAYTKRFSKYAAKTTGLILGLVFVVIGAHKLVVFLNNLEVARFIVMGVFVSVLTIMVFLAYLVYRTGKETYKITISVISYIDKSMNVRRSQKTLRNLMFGMFVVFLGLASPGLIFILQLPAIYALGSVGIVILGLFIMSRVFKLLSHFSNDFAGHVPSYKKYNPDIARLQKK